MLALYVVLAVLVLGALGWWVWSCRDHGTADQMPFGEPKFTDDAENRAER